MNNFKTILCVLTFYALCEKSQTKHVDLQFHPLSAAEVYEILAQANYIANVPADRIITEGIMAETRTSIEKPKGRRARILPILGATSGEGQTVLQEICYSTRSLEHERPANEDEQQQMKNKVEEDEAEEQPQGRQTGTETDSPPSPPDGSSPSPPPDASGPTSTDTPPIAPAPTTVSPPDSPAPTTTAPPPISPAPTTTPTPPSTGGDGVNCIKLEKPIRR